MSVKKEDTELEVGGKGLAFHGPMLYEVKILKVYNPSTGKTTIKHPVAEGGHLEDIDDKNAPEVASEIRYFVHYRGWKVTWDEWIGTDRLLAYNEENLKVMRDLRQSYKEKTNAKKTAGKQTTPKRGAAAAAAAADRDGSAGGGASGRNKDGNASTSGTGRGTKRSRAQADGLGTEEEYLRAPEIQLSIPASLKSLLVDDWELVTKERRVVALPRTPTVADILRQYSEAATPEGDAVSADRETFKEIISGIKLYFDRSLGSVLLYRYERAQYYDIRAAHPNFVASDFYGAEHLLRLFVALPGLIAQTSMDAQAINTLRRHLEDFLRFMSSKQNDYFTTDYEETRRFPDSAVA